MKGLLIIVAIIVAGIVITKLVTKKKRGCGCNAVQQSEMGSSPSSGTVITPAT